MARRSMFSSVLVAALSTVLVVGAAAAPPPAAQASGCSGSATSSTAGGDALDTAAAPGAGGTESDPFDVTWDGPIAWTGSTGAPVQDGSWSVTLEPVGGGLTGRLFAMAVSGLASGEIANQEAKTGTSGSTVLGDYVPVRATTGLYRVSWDVHDASTTCTGSAVVNVTGNPLTTPMFFIALLLVLLGAIPVLRLVRLLR